MADVVATVRVGFESGGQRCAAWLTLPAEPGPHPAIVLAHGLGATHDMMLPQYEQHFAAAGIGVLSFDYRHTGMSDGVPRQHISIRKQCRTCMPRSTGWAGAMTSILAGSDCGGPASAR